MLHEKKNILCNVSKNDPRIIAMCFHNFIPNCDEIILNRP